MKNRIKKILAIILSLSIVLCVVSVSFTVNNGSRAAFEKFSDSVTTLIRNADNQKEIRITSGEYRTRRVIVKAKGKLDTLDAVESAEGYNDLHILQFKSEESAKKAVEYYSSLDNVEFAEPDGIMSTMEIKDEEHKATATAPNGKLQAKESESIGVTQLRSYLSANNITYSQQIVVAVVDTGVEDDHELLDGRIIQNNNNYSTDEQKTSYDNNGHGTHVAGIIINNVLENVSVKPYKVLNSEGSGTDTECYLGIMAAVEDGVDVINMSFGRPGESELITQAIEEADSRGIVCVAAAGNDGVCMDGAKFHYTPASIPQCITVVAGPTSSADPTRDDSYIMRRLSRVSFSNYGQCCEFNAPGYLVTSSFLGNTYMPLSGTSMAAPFVSAAITYVILDKPELSPAQLCERLMYYSIGDSKTRMRSLYIEYVTREIGKLNSPVFSVTQEEFDEDFYLTISGDYSDAHIMYNLSTNPSTFWREYTEPIKIHQNVTVTAYAIRIGMQTSDYVTQAYRRTYSDDESKYVIDSTGLITEYMYDQSESELVIPDTINSIVPTAIAGSVFANRDFESVYLPDSITVIGAGAFYNNKKLTTVVANGVEGIRGFGGCTALKYIECNNVKTIDGGAFSGCTSLTDFDFSNITRIESGAFNGCTGFPSIVSDKLEYIGSNAFANSTIITLFAPNLTEVDTQAFNKASELKNIYSESLEKIGTSAFSNCTSLEEIILENVTDIRTNAFTRTSLKSVHLPQMKSIYYSSTFSCCFDLEVFDAPELKSIGESTLSYCYALKDLYLPALTSLDNVSKYGFQCCTSLESVYLPSLKSLTGAGIFNSCDNLRAMYLPSLTTAKTTSLPSLSGVSIYLTSSFASCNTKTDLVHKIIAPSGSYAEQWANSSGQIFLDCASCSCSGTEDNAFVYTCADNDEQCLMPFELLRQLWQEQEPFNKTSSFAPHGFIFDTYSDGYINIKDYVKTFHLTK